VHIRFSFPLPIPDSGDAPSEFRIWKWGENKTLKGTVVLDEASAKAVVNAFRDHGVELAIDYEHQTFNAEDNGKEAPAAGWFTPEVREDGLWATAVRWTDRASAYLKAKEYRYFSPVALLDDKTRKPVRLMPMALTNWPATKDIEPLVARADATPMENTMKTVLVALGLRAEPDESDAIGALTALKLRADKADALEVDLGKATAELTKLKSDQVAEQKKALIDDAIKGGIAPAKRPELEALDLSALKVCLSLLPKSIPAAVEPADDAPAVAASGLTADQLKILKLTGITPEKFAEHKRVVAQIVNPTEEN
jgi:hypothetical protein